MDLDPTPCYQAMLRRDRRVDGRFFVGVRTTGVYCRPICPAPTPKLVNVQFYACAAAAEAAGFRPCLRCRPETSPGTPAWLGSSAVVSRAMRLIRAGALDGGDVEQLAARLGIGGRQLRRLFDKHLGASPAAVARARRLHFARVLIDETDVAMTEIAFAAGFNSVRQFNHAVRLTFARSPRQLRARRLRPGPARGSEGLTVRLAYRPPFDWSGMLRFMAGRATPGVEAVRGGRYLRTIEIDGAAGWFSVEAEPGLAALRLSVHLPDCAVALPVVERVRRMFDLTADPTAVATHLRRSPA
ncbi:MAG: bifunctional transcriptional activator/DNA repair enzyme AdaA, partial [Candidatus Binatia bacterium]